MSSPINNIPFMDSFAMHLASQLIPFYEIQRCISRNGRKNIFIYNNANDDTEAHNGSSPSPQNQIRNTNICGNCNFHQSLYSDIVQLYWRSSLFISNPVMTMSKTTEFHDYSNISSRNTKYSRLFVDITFTFSRQLHRSSFSIKAEKRPEQIQIQFGSLFVSQNDVSKKIPSSPSMPHGTYIQGPPMDESELISHFDQVGIDMDQYLLTRNSKKAKVSKDVESKSIDSRSTLSALLAKFMSTALKQMSSSIPPLNDTESTVSSKSTQIKNSDDRILENGSFDLYYPNFGHGSGTISIKANSPFHGKTEIILPNLLSLLLHNLRDHNHNHPLETDLNRPSHTPIQQEMLSSKSLEILSAWYNRNNISHDDVKVRDGSKDGINHSVTCVSKCKLSKIGKTSIQNHHEQSLQNHFSNSESNTKITSKLCGNSLSSSIQLSNETSSHTSPTFTTSIAFENSSVTKDIEISSHNTINYNGHALARRNGLGKRQRFRKITIGKL